MIAICKHEIIIANEDLGTLSWQHLFSYIINNKVVEEILQKRKERFVKCRPLIMIIQRIQMFIISFFLSWIETKGKQGKIVQSIF